MEFRIEHDSMREVKVPADKETVIRFEEGTGVTFKALEADGAKADSTETVTGLAGMTVPAPEAAEVKNEYFEFVGWALEGTTDIVTGSIVIEQVFGIPGIGRLLIASVSARDYPTVQTLVMYIAILILIVNFIVDIMIQVLDPRIRISR